MDVEFENLQFLGICGILRETIKMIQKGRRIFTQIALAFILPLSLLAFANMVISNFFVQKLTPDPDQHILPSISNAVPSEIIIYYVLFAIASFFISTIFSLLSTSTVVYTAACIYTARDVSFKQVIGVVPKIWKRLLLTFLCVFAALFAFNFVAFFVIVLMLMIPLLINGPNGGFSFGVVGSTILFFFIIFYCVMIWYLTISWQLSYVVSVLEDSYGFKAMTKSKALVKERMRMASKLLIVMKFPFGAAQLVFQYLVFQSSPGMVGRGILAIIWILSFLLFILVNLVAETVLYFVCKSYHHESVDKSALSDHLQGYLLVDYVPLKVDDDVRLEKLQVV